MAATEKFAAAVDLGVGRYFDHWQRVARLAAGWGSADCNETNQFVAAGLPGPFDLPSLRVDCESVQQRVGVPVLQRGVGVVAHHLKAEAGNIPAVCIVGVAAKVLQLLYDIARFNGCILPHAADEEVLCQE